MEGKLKKFVAVAGAFVGAFSLTGAAMADSFQEHIDQCVSKFATNSLTASVVLECTAGSGKLSDCKVVQNSMEGKGFDKAAVCLSAYIPMGSRTGPVRVPLKFQGS
jgi:hypothetical protein